jgi:hypothetical protein
MKDNHQISAAAFLSERKAYTKYLRSQRGLQRKYANALMIYLLRRLLWSFGFFPVFIAFWLPLVLARFNPVAMVSDILPVLERFVNANPEIQSATIDTVLLSWLSIGVLFALFDFILTPFKSPIEYEADIHMRAWEQSRSSHVISTEDVNKAS